MHAALDNPGIWIKTRRFIAIQAAFWLSAGSTSCLRYNDPRRVLFPGFITILFCRCFCYYSPYLRSL